MSRSRSTPFCFLPALLLVAGCAAPRIAPPTPAPGNTDGFGVLLLAHGGSPEWDRGVMGVVAPLQEQFAIEVAFGMADAATIQAATRRLEARGIRRVGVVRLFISGDSWLDRTEQILGLQPGAPPRQAPSTESHDTGHDGSSHGAGFWRIATDATYALSIEGLAEAPLMGAVIADRARALSRNPRMEDVLVVAHGPGDDAENARWISDLDARANTIRNALPFRRVEVETIREDWPEKRKEAERRMRRFVERAAEEKGTGLVPHSHVTEWIAGQISALRKGPFRARIKP